MIELPEDVAGTIAIVGLCVLGTVLLFGAADLGVWLYESVHPAAAYGIAACVGVVLVAFGFLTFPVEGNDEA